MSRPTRLVLLLVVTWSFGSTGLVLAQGTPVVMEIFPPGATVGKSMEWVISGHNLSKSRSLVISGGGVEVVSLRPDGDDSARVQVRISDDAVPGFREVRLDGPSGVSNLTLVRIDRLEQVVEIEPNQVIGEAQGIAPGTGVSGHLRSLDVDHYRIQGVPGQKLTIDLEARRLGTSISPVVTIFAADGAAIAQGRESRSLDRDCRMSLIVPRDGTCLVQVRDNTYDGNDLARYRLRVDPSPFATAVFPLGGVPGQLLHREISGGNLDQPLSQSIRLPEIPGSLFDPGGVAGPLGPITIPGRILVGEGPEILEPIDHAASLTLTVASGLVINGRLGKPGEVDRFPIAVKKGERFRFRTQAVALGSWLDSVLTLRDGQGGLLEENDDNLDTVRPDLAGSLNAIGLPQGSPDSMIEHEAKEDATLTIEVSDRFGDGGSEFAYRLEIKRDQPDLAITLLFGNANASSNGIANRKPPRNAQTAAGPLGVLNVKPGDSVPINVLITPEGRPGPVELTVEGLPDGVTADPVLIRFPGAKSNPKVRADPVADFLILKVASVAQPGLSEIRVVARGKPSADQVIERTAAGVIAIDASPVAGRPVIRVVDRIPLRVLGENAQRK